MTEKTNLNRRVGQFSNQTQVWKLSTAFKATYAISNNVAAWWNQQTSRSMTSKHLWPPSQKDTPATPAALGFSRALKDELMVPTATGCQILGAEGGWRQLCASGFRAWLPRASPAELRRHKSETDKSVFRSLLDTLLKQKTLFLWKQSRCYHVSSVLERDWMLERQACMTPFSLVNEQLQRFPLQILHQWWQFELWNQMTIVFPSP